MIAGCLGATPLALDNQLLSIRPQKEINFILRYSRKMPHDHSHDQAHSHSHDQAAIDHGHTHEVLDGPGSYMGREMPIIEGRDWSERAFTIGIGG